MELFLNMSGWPHGHSYVNNSSYNVDIVGKNRLTKRSRALDDEDDYEILQSKRFLSEDQMMNHLEQLQLTTPPYTVEENYTTNETTHTEWLLGNESDWLNETTPTNDWYYGNEISSIDYSLTNEDNPYTNVNSDFITEDKTDETKAMPINNDKWNVLLEDLSVSSSDSSPPTQVWLAPEVKDLLNATTKQSLLPSEVIKEMSKPCTALIPYVKPSNQIEQIFWKCQIMKHIEKSVSDEDKFTLDNDKSELYKNSIQKNSLTNKKCPSEEELWTDDEMEL